MIGRTVSHYRLVEKLGEGGMGEVWIADDETLHRRVALKAIRTDRRLDPRSRARFLREARILSALDHPQICRIHDYLEEDGHDYLVLELVEGSDLRAAILGGLDRAAVLEIVDKVNGALVAAHAAGVVHRDLKPANVLRTPEGGVKVLDFGLAATADVAAADTPSPPQPHTAGELGLDLTEDGTAVGTLRYMSPEQARGEPATAASDMYALGLLLVELQHGHPAFPRHRDLAALLAHVQRGATVPAALRSTELGRLAERLLNPAPTRRPTAVDVAERLHWIRERPRRVLRRGLVAAGVAIAGLAGLKYTLDLDAQRGRAETARLGAEELVDFMLGDLHDQLAAVGRLDALAGSADKVLAYLDARRDENVDDAARFRRARSLLGIGEVRFVQHRLDEALPIFEEARTICAGLRTADPTNAEWALALGAAEFWIGNSYLERKDLDAAERSFTAYRELARELVATDPDAPSFLKELGYAHTNMLAIHLRRGDTGAAVREARDGLGIKRALNALDPSNQALRRDLASGLGWLGAALKEDGQLAEARGLIEEELALRRHEVEAAPRDVNALGPLSVCLQRLATLLSWLGQDEEAVAFLRENLGIAERLVRLEPGNARWRRELAMSRRSLADLHLRAGRIEEAALLADASRAGFEELLAQDSESLHAMLGLAASQRQSATLHLTRGDLDRALDAAHIGMSFVAACQERGEQSSELADIHGRLLLHRGEALDRRGAHAEARTAWELADLALAPVAQGGKPPHVVCAWIRVLVGLGRAADAEPHAERLTAGGYAARDFVGLCREAGWPERWSEDHPEKEK